MDDQERLEIYGTVLQYREMESKFVAIAKAMQEALRNNNDYGITFLESNGNSVKLRVLDNFVEVSFSFLIDESKTIFGKISCERMLHENKRELITIFYIDTQGVMNDQVPPKYICDHRNKYIGDRLLMHLLDKYINMPCFTFDRQLPR